jgi:hypothetical protein
LLSKWKFCIPDEAIRKHREGDRMYSEGQRNPCIKIVHSTTIASGYRHCPVFAVFA